MTSSVEHIPAVVWTLDRRIVTAVALVTYSSSVNQPGRQIVSGVCRRSRVAVVVSELTPFGR